jgi:lantibiotic modifying enzyme
MAWSDTMPEQADSRPKNQEGDTKIPSWIPLFEGSEAARVENVVESICRALTNTEVVRLYGQSLSGGMSGVALFFSYAARTWPNQAWQAHANDWLARATNETESTEQAPDLSLYRGATGVAWTVQHLGPEWLPTQQDPRHKVDRWIFETVTRRWHGHFDLVTGLAGHVVYALERLQSEADISLLEAVINQLADMAVQSPPGVSWWTPPALMSLAEQQSFTDGFFNLGLAHGLPGVIAVLALTYAAGVARKRVRPLLQQATGWLLAQRNPIGAASCFGNFARTVTGPPLWSRVAWCYGDLGLAAALYLAGAAVGERAWEEEAVEIARLSAKRAPERSGVCDAPLCHGAAGNAHIFNRFYQATRDPLFADTARYWFNRTLEYRVPSYGLDGFISTRPAEDADDRPQRWSPGLLDGSAGIGLALLASITTIEPSWDRSMLVALPTRAPASHLQSRRRSATPVFGRTVV